MWRKFGWCLEKNEVFQGIWSEIGWILLVSGNLKSEKRPQRVRSLR